MNHDSLKQGLYMSFMSVYNTLLHEYKNEIKAKKEFLNIINNLLSDLSIEVEIGRAINKLVILHKNESNLSKKKEIYTKLSVLNDALKIMEQINNA